MRGRFLPLGLWLCLSGIALGLDAQSQKLADRYLAILTANPMQQTAFDRLWKIHSEGGEIDALIAVCQQRAAEAPVLYARVLQRAGRTGEAKKVLAEAAGSGILQAAEMLSGLLEEDGDLAAAAKLLEEAPGAQQNPAVLVRLGELLLKTGELDKSRSAWNRAVALDPGDLALRKRLAAASIRAADWNEAVAHLQVIAKHGTPSERFNALGEISLRLESAGKIAEAIDAQDALLHLMGPGHWQLDSARRRLLSLHDKNHSLDVLEKQWRADAESDPRDPQSALRLAKLYEFQGDDLQRHEWLSRAATLLPNDAPHLRPAALDLALGSRLPRAATTRCSPQARRSRHLFAGGSKRTHGTRGRRRGRIESYLRAHADDDTAAAGGRFINLCSLPLLWNASSAASSPILTTCRRFLTWRVLLTNVATRKRLVVSRALKLRSWTRGRPPRSRLDLANS
jgi:tetratricopeptide (TPR) repeat protein